MSRAHQSEVVQGFDYRPDRVPGSGGGHAVAWTRADWRRFIVATEKAGGTIERYTDTDGTRTTVIRERIAGRLDGAAEAYGL